MQLTELDTLYELDESLIKLYPGSEAVPDDLMPYSYLTTEDLYVWEKLNSFVALSPLS